MTDPAAARYDRLRMPNGWVEYTHGARGASYYQCTDGGRRSSCPRDDAIDVQVAPPEFHFS